MTRDHRHDEPRDDSRDEDLVAAFFRAERESIVPEPADELRWRRIAREGRRTSRRQRVVPAFAAAAAAAIIGVVGVQHVTNERQQVAPAHQVASVGQPLPLGSRVMSVSEVAGTSSALVDTVCAEDGGRCPVVARSTDAGRTWSVTAVLTNSEVPAARPLDASAPVTAGATSAASRTGGSTSSRSTSTNAPGVVTAQTLAHIVFADAQHGFAWGGRALATTDGGRTWHDVEHPGDILLDVAVDGGRVALASVKACDGHPCGEPLVIVSQGLDGKDRRQVSVPTNRGTAPVEEIHLAWIGDELLVSGMTRRDGERVAMVPARIDTRGAVVQLARAGEGCTNDTGRLLAVADGGRTIYGHCALADADAHAGLTLQASVDGGLTWTFRTLDPVLAIPANDDIAAIDDRHVVLAARDSNTVLVSNDGGQTYRAPTTPPRSTVGALSLRAEGRTAVLVPRGENDVYYRSADGGQTWSRVVVTGDADSSAPPQAPDSTQG